MTSEKQKAANRRNAQLSTGPRTESGKQKSRLNAVRDNLTGQVTTLNENDRPAFEQLKTEMLADFNPQTAMERKLANAIAWDTWRLDHLRAIEMNIYALGQQNEADAEDTTTTDIDYAFADARTFQAEAPRLELMSLYEQRMTRNIHRNMALLRNLQAERKRNYEHDKSEEIKIGRVCEINHIPIRASLAPSRNGFIFSDDEIALATVRQRYLESADYVLKHAAVNKLYGNLHFGVGDTILEKVADKVPVSKEEYDAIHAVHIETRTLHRQNNPEEYGLSDMWPAREAPPRA